MSKNAKWFWGRAAAALGLLGMILPAALAQAPQTSQTTQTAQASQAPQISQAPQTQGSGCSDELQKLKKEHEALLLDYNNVVAQAKALMVYKNKVRDMEDASRQFGVLKEQWVQEREATLSAMQELKEKLRREDETVAKLTQERDEYKKSFEKATVENIMGEETKKKIADLQKEKDLANAKIGELQARIKEVEEVSLKKDAQAELYRLQTLDLKEKYAESQKNNRLLEEKVEAVPKRVAELARENKVLIKQTAMMHYNLGVFYSENKEFDRAIAEFEKAVELDPLDAASQFNLGYIYAEHLQNRAKAVDHFRQFLKLAKKDDKEVDWVKRYVLTWQTWETGSPIK